MKLTTQQHLEIRQHLLGLSLTEDTLDELYDHLITSLEQKPASTKFNMTDVRKLIHTEFSDLINNPEKKKEISKDQYDCWFWAFWHRPAHLLVDNGTYRKFL
ncbi:hypothetical protein [Pedobacter sp. NJ-S-72]